MSIFTTEESIQKSERVIRALQHAVIDASEILDKNSIDYVVRDTLGAILTIGVEQVRDVLTLDELADFTFTAPQPPTPLKFFEGVDTSQLYTVDKPFKVGEFVFDPHRKTFGIIADVDPESTVNIAIRWHGDGMKLWYADTELADLKRVVLEELP